jgi:glycosyltransferase involved in cell wall biosynthesis
MVQAERHETIPALVDDLAAAGVRRLHVLAWRDLDDPDAGGSELHADECMRRWAAAGLDIVHRTSAAIGQPPHARRNGYAVVRRGSRYGVFPRTAVAEVLRRMGPSDALVEIWNGVPWMSPLWYRRPRLTIVHHVHGPMWEQSLPWPLAPLGRAVEACVAPVLYRRGAVVTPSQSTRDELLELGFRPGRVTAVDNGVDDFFRPSADRRADEADEPLAIVVGRLAPVKRFGLALEVAAAARRRVPGLRLRVVGDGPVRPELETWIAEHRAGDWVTLVGRVEHEALREEYRRAWVVLSASLVEGWGLTLTEAGGCATPAVATDIRGHRSSVADGVTGLLVEPDGLADALVRVLSDADLRHRLGTAAAARAAALTWEATATGVLRVLRDEVVGAQR